MTTTVNQGVVIAAITGDAPPRVNQGVIIAAVSFTPPNSPPQINQGVLIAAVRQFPVTPFLEIAPAVDLPCIAGCNSVPFFSRSIRDTASSGATGGAMLSPINPTPEYHWMVSTGPGVREYFPTPDEACRRMHERYNPSARYDGFEMQSGGTVAHCKWTGPGTAPASVYKVKKD
jgi:hypothetical protein